MCPWTGEKGLPPMKILFGCLRRQLVGGGGGYMGGSTEPSQKWGGGPGRGPVISSLKPGAKERAPSPVAE